MAQNSKLNSKKVMAEFETSEHETNKRQGHFKIDAPFDEAMKTILKAKPKPRRSRAKKNKKHNQ